MNREGTDLTGLEIAVIGISGRFPGANNVQKFWENLVNGKESIKRFSDEELRQEGVSEMELNSENYVKANGVLEDKKYFDSDFFNYKPNEAEVMDPQMRIMHECVWEALEDSGYNPFEYNSEIGLYVGASRSFDWRIKTILSGKANKIGEWPSGFLSEKDLISTRISYKLNLRGPSLTLSTECSSSLVAIHLASRALLTGECSIALAGGVSIKPFNLGYTYEEGMINSPDGHCRAFDSEANGTVGGEGAGVVVLKRLSEAILDKDNIYAIIKGSALNNDGADKVSYTAPSTIGQSNAIKMAFSNANTSPESISYLEAHGTGTNVGDAIEIEALKLAFSTIKKRFCAIGSVKTNVGHLDAAAGIAGFIKTALMLHHKIIPPSLNFVTENPKIDFNNSPFYVNTQLRKWESEYPKLRAGVSSFGAGGTNAHIILEEVKDNINNHYSSLRKYFLLNFSAFTENSLNQLILKFSDYFKRKNNTDLLDAAFTLQTGRKYFPYRKTIVCSNTEEASQTLQSLVNEKPLISLPGNKPKIAFMFSGQGSQYMNMGKELYLSEPVFKNELDRCFNILFQLEGVDFKKIIFTDDIDLNNSSINIINETQYTQPILFVFEYSLAKLLITWGVLPDVMIGHSIGEYVAACLSGVFTLETALYLVKSRGDLIKRLPKGKMLGINAMYVEILPYLNDEISLAAINSDSNCVVSGKEISINRLMLELNAKGITYTKLHTSHAFHSYMMDDILEEYKNELEKVKLNKPDKPYISNVTGSFVPEDEVTTPDYWIKHLRQEVNFKDGTNTILNAFEKIIFIELGPGNTLCNFVNRNKSRNNTQKSVNLIKNPKEIRHELEYFYQKIGLLWAENVEINWNKVYENENPGRISLPTYSFEKKEYWISKKDLTYQQVSEKKGKLNIENWLNIPFWRRSNDFNKANNLLSKDTYFLVLGDGNLLENSFLQKLNKKGYKTIYVKKSEHFEKIDFTNYTLNALAEEHYVNLLQNLKQHNIKSLYLIDFLGVNINNGSLCIDQINTHFYSLLYFIKAIEHQNYQELKLNIITNDLHSVIGNENICLQKAPMIGQLKTISQEYSHVNYKNIDISASDLATFGLEIVCSQVFQEIISTSDDDMIAFRNKLRWIKDFKQLSIPVKLNGLKTAKKNSCYLITGGFGRIGIALARNLVECFDADVILTGRSPIPDKLEWEELVNSSDNNRLVDKIRLLYDIKSKVHYFQADISDSQQMNIIVNKAIDKIGHITGIIHSAGILGKNSLSTINKINEQKCHEQFTAKIEGVLNINSIVKRIKPEICILMSSISSELGGIGYASYAAANSFLDSFAESKTTKDNTKWLSIAWDAWVFEESQEDDFRIKPDEGIKIFNRILQDIESFEGRVIVSATMFSERINKWVKQQNLKITVEDTVIENEKTDVDNEFSNDKSILENKIAKIIAHTTGIKNINSTENFQDLGINSLDIIQLNGLLKTNLNIHIPIVAWLENPTIREVVNYIENSNTQTSEDAASKRKSEISRGKDKIKLLMSKKN